MLTASENSVTEIPKLEVDIARLKSLREQIVAMKPEADKFALELGRQFGDLRNQIDKSLAWLLLQREIEADR